MKLKFSLVCLGIVTSLSAMDSQSSYLNPKELENPESVQTQDWIHLQRSLFTDYMEGKTCRDAIRESLKKNNKF